jgi:6-pyruvoyltetrahydropterin/6-carboxytetrahydropterin synthase
MSWELVVKDKFSSAHFLEHYKGKCEKMHGHTFEIEAYFKIEENALDKSGIGIDFTEIKAYLKEILPDHKVLNEEFDFSPSAENLSRYLYYKIKEKYPICKLTVWESEYAGAVYTED